MTPSLHDLLKAGGENVLATDDHGQSVTYEETLKHTQETRFPFEPGKGLVLLLCGNSVASVQMLLTLLARGHAVILAPPKADDGLIEEMAGRFQPDAISNPDRDEWRDRPVAVDRSLHADLALMLSTSGSTGSPKLARFTLPALLANGQAIAEYLELRPSDVAFAHLPLHYSYGLSILTSHLARSAAIALTSYSLMERPFWARWREAGATSFPGVPTHYQLLFRLGLKRLATPSLRIFTQAGGRLAPELVLQTGAFAKISGMQFFVMYGQTEAGPRIAYLPPEFTETRPNAIGIPIPGVELWLKGGDGAEVLPGGEGELMCRSPSVMMGYAESSGDLANGDIMNGLLPTGDLAVRDPDGLYRITGRISRFLKVMGNRVSLDHVEALMAAEGASVTAVGRDDWLCVVTEDPDQDLDLLKARLVEHISAPPSAMAVRHLPAIPRSESGKVLYRKLLAEVSEGELT